MKMFTISKFLLLFLSLFLISCQKEGEETQSSDGVEPANYVSTARMAIGPSVISEQWSLDDLEKILMKSFPKYEGKVVIQAADVLGEIELVSIHSSAEESKKIATEASADLKKLLVAQVKEAAAEELAAIERELKAQDKKVEDIQQNLKDLAELRGIIIKSKQKPKLDKSKDNKKR